MLKSIHTITLLLFLSRSPAILAMEVELTELSQQPFLATYSTHSSHISSLALSSDKSHLACSTYGPDIVDHDIGNDLKESSRFKGIVKTGPKKVAHHPTQPTIACNTGVEDQPNKQVVFVDTRSGKESGRLTNDHPIQSLLFPPDGWAIITQGETIKVWDSRNQVAIHEISSPDDAPFYSMTHHPRQNIIIAASARVHMWYTLGPTLHGSLSNPIPKQDRPFSHIHSLHEGTRLIYALEPIDVSPDDSTIAAASNTGTVSLCDVAQREEVCHFKACAGAITTILYQDNQRIITGGKDCMIKLFDLQRSKSTEPSRPKQKNVLEKLSSLLKFDT